MRGGVGRSEQDIRGAWKMGAWGEGRSERWRVRNTRPGWPHEEAG